MFRTYFRVKAMKQLKLWMLSFDACVSRMTKRRDNSLALGILLVYYSVYYSVYITLVQIYRCIVDLYRDLSLLLSWHFDEFRVEFSVNENIRTDSRRSLIDLVMYLGKQGWRQYSLLDPSPSEITRLIEERDVRSIFRLRQNGSSKWSVQSAIAIKSLIPTETFRFSS